MRWAANNPEEYEEIERGEREWDETSVGRAALAHSGPRVKRDPNAEWQKVLRGRIYLDDEDRAMILAALGVAWDFMNEAEQQRAEALRGRLS